MILLTIIYKDGSILDVNYKDGSFLSWARASSSDWSGAQNFLIGSGSGAQI